MATSKPPDEKTTVVTPPTGTPPAGTTPEPGVVVTPGTAVVADPPVVTQPPALTSTDTTIVKKILTGEEPDEDLEKLVDDKGQLPPMPFKALKTRINRATNTELTKLFGTADRAEIKKKIDAYAAASEELEKQRREKLDENARLKEDLDKQKTENARILEEQEAREFDQARAQATKEVRTLALKHVDADEKCVKTALKEFRAHLRTLSEGDVEKLSKDSEKVSGWFEDWAKKNPRFAKEAATAEPAPKKKGLTNGGGGNDKPNAPPSGTDASKRPINMSKVEWAEKKKAMGLNY